MKNVVVFGGTGNQGSAFVRALAEYNTPDVQYDIYVLSRSANSAASTRLAALPGVRVTAVRQDYADNPFDAIAATGLQKGDVDVLFNVQGYMSEEKDEAQGKGIVDAAVAFGVKHFIYASIAHDDTVENGDDGLDPKRHIEKYIKTFPALGYTMLRSTDFMDNWLPTATYTIKCYRTILLRRTFTRDPEAKLHMISTRDVGRAGAAAVHHPERHMNKAYILAGDANSMREVQETYERVMGEKVQETYGFVAGLVQWLEPTVAKLTRFYNQGGYTVPAEQTRAILPDAEDFAGFLQRFKREQAAKE